LHPSHLCAQHSHPLLLTPPLRSPPYLHPPPSALIQFPFYVRTSTPLHFTIQASKSANPCSELQPVRSHPHPPSPDLH
jgi:hypothetical protein